MTTKTRDAAKAMAAIAATSSTARTARAEYLDRRTAKESKVPFVVAPDGTVTWVCDVCQHLIRHGRLGVSTGTIQVNRDLAIRHDRAGHDPQVTAPVRWNALHGRCNPNPRTTVVYRLPVEDLAHVDHFTEWTRVFAQHEWTAYTDWDRLASHTRKTTR